MVEIIDKIKDMVGLKDTEKEAISLKDSDNDLNKKLTLRIDESESIKKTKTQRWDRNLRFFDGDHWKVAGVLLPTYKADLFINKVFAAFRSLVAYETDAKPEPVVNARITSDTPIEGRDELVNTTKKIESMLDYKWDARQIPITLTEIYYDRYIFDDGFGMYFWNAVDDDVDFELIKPQELFRSPGSTSVEDAEYLIVAKWRNKKYFNDNYPDDVDKIDYTNMPDVQPGDVLTESAQRNNLAKVYYYFEDDIWIVKCGDKILEKKQNPFWEWRKEDEQIDDLIKQLEIKVGKKQNKREALLGVLPEWKPIRNHLRKPEKPIVHFKGYHLGGEFYSRSLMKQIIKLNMAVNKRKCQIQDIIDGTGSPQWIIDPSVSKDDAERITSKPGLKIRINPTLIRKEPAAAPPLTTFEDMLHSEQKFNDLVGLHEVSTGATTRKRQTKGELELLKESDITPIRLLMRNSESAIIKLINGWVQLMKLYYDQPHYIGQLGAVGVERYGEFLVREDIPDNLSILIKVGSTMPVSREMRRSQYIQDFSMGAISLQDYLRLMDYPNPDKLVANVQAQQQGQVAQGGQGVPPA